MRRLPPPEARPVSGWDVRKVFGLEESKVTRLLSTVTALKMSAKAAGDSVRETAKRKADFFMGG